MKKMMCFLLCSLIVISSCQRPAKTLTDEEIQHIAYDAYIYALPLVIMDLTLRASINVTPENGAPINQFNHRPPASPKDRLIVRPNFDTMYSFAFLDLSEGPLVLSKPETGIYCSISILDAYTNANEKVIGTGGLDDGKAAQYLLTGPGYNGGDVPGLVRVSIPTNMAWIMVRTAYDDINDLSIPSSVQNSLSLIPLAEIDNPLYILPAGSFDPANDYVTYVKIQQMDIVTFFNVFNELSILNPGTSEDETALKRFAQIGVGPGLAFDMAKFSQRTQQVLQDMPALVLNRLEGQLRDSNSSFFRQVNNWSYMSDNLARFGTDYEFRAVIAYTGLGGNPVEMAKYFITTFDSNAKSLDGNNRYVIHFEEDQFPPPNRAFWSITIYSIDGVLVDNPIDRYAVRGRDTLLKNSDGSVDIYLQYETPGQNLEANWLPVPKEPFQLALRVYLPEDSVLNLSWNPPAVLLK